LTKSTNQHSKKSTLQAASLRELPLRARVVRPPCNEMPCIEALLRIAETVRRSCAAMTCTSKPCSASSRSLRTSSTVQVFTGLLRAQAPTDRKDLDADIRTPTFLK